MEDFKTFDEFLNEAGPGIWSSMKTATVRSANQISKSLKGMDQSQVGQKIHNMLNWGINQEIWSGSPSTYPEVFNGTYFPYTDKGKRNLIDKAESALKDAVYKDSDLQNAYESYVQSKKDAEDKQKAERAAAEAAKQLAEAEERAKKDRALYAKVPGIELILEYKKKYLWYVQRNPWSTPDLESEDSGKISTAQMEVGKVYLVSRGTYYEAGRGNGLLWGSVIEYLGEKDGEIQADVLVQVGMYGPSVWCSVDHSNKPRKISTDTSGWLLTDWVKRNKAEVERNIKILDEKTVKYMASHGDSKPDWDPNWGMN